MKTINLALILLLGSTATSFVSANEDSKYLVSSCHELLEIYVKRDQQHLLAGLTTSTSEALRAGYCRGVLDEYRRGNDSCAQNNWYAQAARIATYPEYAEELPEVSTLLEESCEL